MKNYLQDIYKEPVNFSVDTMQSLGPLSHLAGEFSGSIGVDVKPKATGAKSQEYIETMRCFPIDPITNGPQLIYGLRYHTHITKPNQIKTYHEQVGYFLWEPQESIIYMTVSIPRGVTGIASAIVPSNANAFTLTSTSMQSVPFLKAAFDTVSFTIDIIIHSTDSWSYSQDTVLKIAGTNDLFHHTDKNTLQRIQPPTPNPLAQKE
ncbi:MAG: heme-binding beta-barrel domain-containing protein [Methylacidiphilales bacterium]|nr:heme-binding beta-barrel domain-containing protein [Candidatus Methylacidiphilales bacterium]